jgi:hypothetical protein
MNDKLVTFLYLLMRDELPTGKVENLIAQANVGRPIFSGAYLESYARQLAERLAR